MTLRPTRSAIGALTVLSALLLLGCGPSGPTEPSQVVVRDAFTAEGTVALDLRRGDDITTEVQVVTADEAVSRLAGERP